jgi:hypothetical protein
LIIRFDKALNSGASPCPAPTCRAVKGQGLKGSNEIPLMQGHFLRQFEEVVLPPAITVEFAWGPANGKKSVIPKSERFRLSYTE